MLTQITRITCKWIYTEYPALKIFHRSGFQQTLNRSATLRLPQTECALNSLYWIYLFYHQGFFSNSRLPENQSSPENFHSVEYIFFIIQDFWATCACPEKQILPWNFPRYWTYLSHSGFLSSFRLALKNRVVPKFFTVLKYFSSFRIFEQVALSLKTEFSLKFFIPGGRQRHQPPPRTPMAASAVFVCTETKEKFAGVLPQQCAAANTTRSGVYFPNALPPMPL